jgi:hypothetical protein
MFEKRLVPDINGDEYRIFEESFARRFGEGEGFTEEDRKILKTSWTRQAKAYYGGLQPHTANRLMAAPITHDTAFMEQALHELRGIRTDMLNLL